MSRRSRFVGRPLSQSSDGMLRICVANASRLALLSGVSAYNVAATLAGPRRSDTPQT